jgi:hypothetical protein
MGRVSQSKQNNYGQRPALPEIPKVEIPRNGGRSAIKAEERRRNIEAAKTPFVPPAPTSPSSTRQGGRARVSGGIQIGVPQSSPISTQRPNRSSNTTSETPVQNPERPTTPGNSGKITGALPATVNQNLGAYDSSVTLPGMTRGLPSDYKETEQVAGQKAEDSRAGAGFGSEQRVSPTGVVQTGTSTSPKPMTMDDANKLLSGGYKIENPYSSNQLPTTASSPYAGKSNAQIYNPDTLHQHVQGTDYVSLSKNLFEDRSGVETYQRGKNMNADYKQMDVNPGQKVPEEKINWANRTMADNSDEKVRRRSAMLDDYNGADGNPVGLMERMRNQEAIQGRKYAGGQHWQVNKNAGQEGQNDFVEISAGQARARSNYTKTADEVFANHLGKAKEKASSADFESVAGDAPAMLPGAVPGQTPMDKSPFDTEELMQQKPGKSIIGDNTPYTSVNRGTLLR